MNIRPCEYKDALLAEADEAQAEIDRHDVGPLDPRAIGPDGLIAQAEARLERAARRLADCSLKCVICGIDTLSMDDAVFEPEPLSVNDLIIAPIPLRRCPMKDAR